MATAKSPQPPSTLQTTLQLSRKMEQMGCHSTPPMLVDSKNQYSAQKFFKMMKYERLRLITYLLYGHQWPKMDLISPSELAKAGFFYLHDDAVQCAFCRGVIGQWNAGDNPMEEHQRFFPKCAFVLGEYCGNMPVEIDPDVNCEKSNFKSAVEQAPTNNSGPGMNNYSKSDIPCYPIFSEPSNRSKTYSHANWRSPLGRQQLIDSGFFYTGQGDCVRCFHCGGKLFNWAPNENPLEEHARFFPECRFMISSRGENYIEFVQFKSQIIDLRQKMDSPQALTDADIECMKNISYENFLNMKQAAYKMINKLEKHQPSGSGDTSSDTNFVQRYLNKFSFLTDCQKLFQYLTSLDIMKVPTSPTSPESPNTSLESTSSSSQGSQQSSIFSLDDNNEADCKSTKSSSDEEDDQPKKACSLECIICRDKQIEIVFVPCGHQLACRKCADKISKCPVCKSDIDTKVRTYFAH